MSTTPGLYQSSGRRSALVGVHTPGGTDWRQQVSALFGAGYDPDYGWNFDRFGAVESGSVGRARVGGRINPPLGVGAQRVGSSRYSPCDAAGHAVTTVPSTSLPAIAHAAGMRVWASPSGLEAVRG